MEESIRFKDQEIDKKDGTIRRMTDSEAVTKKKLMQAEVKIRQLTQATIKDLKLKLKQKTNEIDVLKEMVKSSSNTLKAKDMDIKRLNKMIARLEKMVELNKNYDGPSQRNNYDMIPERDEEFEETQNQFGMPNMKLNHGGFGGVNEQVNQELLQH